MIGLPRTFSHRFDREVAMGLKAGYEIHGTDVVCGAARIDENVAGTTVEDAGSLLALTMGVCCAMSRTEMGCAATRRLRLLNSMTTRTTR